MPPHVRAALTALALLAPAGAARAQSAPAPVSAESLRGDLFAVAADSMGGRATGSVGNWQAAEWVAAAFQHHGLEPAGENGTFFQTVPFWRMDADTSSGLVAGGRRLAVGSDLLPIGLPMTWTAAGVPTLYGGVVNDSATWPAAGLAAGKLVVLSPSRDGDWRASLAFPALRRNPRFRGAAGFAIAALGDLPAEVVRRLRDGQVTRDSTAATINLGQLVVSASAAEALLGTPLASASPGHGGPIVTGSIRFSPRPLRYPARNVVAVLRGADPAFSGTYVAVSAHNDHVGTGLAVDHDSLRAFDRVVRPMGADSRMRAPTPEEQARIRAILDSLRASHPPRRDSVFNGADDDGSGTVLLVELARVLSAGPRARRSVLFVSHAAEEIGLLGSRWFTDHPTVPRDSIVAELDVDMVGRGGAADLPGGGPGYLELVGSRRLSTELGNLIDSIGTHERVPFRFNYQYDAPGHPLQYYCRADHFSYARYGIPSASLSTGEHLDYHQVTDEPQYIDYQQLARVTELVRDVALAVANLDHRPVVDGRRQDPQAACRQ